jgi:dihydrofolate synthase/folylpolyglutamate synthase
VDNAGLAVAALWHVKRLNLTENHVRAGLSGVRWPGRFEMAGPGGRIVLDGAHSVAAAEALANAYADSFPGQQCTIILGVLRDKDPIAIARSLRPVASSFITVTPPGPRGLDAHEVAAQLTNGNIPATAYPTIRDALDIARNAPALVTGSLNTVAAAREVLGLALPDPSFSA